MNKLSPLEIKILKIISESTVFYSHHNKSQERLKRVIAVHNETPEYLEVSIVDGLRFAGFLSVVERDCNGHYTTVCLTESGRLIIQELT